MHILKISTKTFLVMVCAFLGVGVRFSDSVQAGVTNVINLSNTGSTNCSSPPAGFNPILATPAEITLYGLPKKPSGDASAWLDLVKKLKHQVCNGAQPTSVIHRGLPVQDSQSILPATTTNIASNNWSGFANLSSANGGPRYQSARGYYTMTCTSTGNNPRGTHAEWVGMGGIYSKSLWQAGWDDMNRYFWYADINTNGVGGNEFRLLNIIHHNCGDTGFAYVDYNYSVPGGVYANVGDVTLGTYQQVSLSSTYVDQESVEWVDERSTCPAPINYPSQIYNYNQNYWRGDFRFQSNNTNGSLNYGSYAYIDMYDDYSNGDPTLLSEQGGYVSGVYTRHTLSDPTDFVDKWQNIAPAGYYGNC